MDTVQPLLVPGEHPGQHHDAANVDGWPSQSKISARGQAAARSIEHVSELAKLPKVSSTRTWCTLPR